MTGVKGTKLENLGHWMSCFSGLERGKCEKEEETRYQENIGRKEGNVKMFFPQDGFIYLVIIYCNSRYFGGEIMIFDQQ